MDLNFLTEFAIPVVVGICLCLGYLIKTSTNINNKYIPLIVSVIGVILNVWVNKSINANILLGGLFSGLASTGLHQLFINSFIENKKGVQE